MYWVYVLGDDDRRRRAINLRQLALGMRRRTRRRLKAAMTVKFVAINDLALFDRNTRFSVVMRR